MLRRVTRRVLADSIVVFIAYSTAYLTCLLSSNAESRLIPVPWFWLIMIGIYIGVNATLGFYHRIWGSGSVLEPLWLLVSTGISTLLVFATKILVFPEIDKFYALAVCLIGGVLTCGGFLLIRYRLFFWQRFRKKPSHNPEIHQARVLIVGITREAQQLAVHLAHDDFVRYKVVGFIDHDPKHRNMVVVRWPVLGLPEDIPLVTNEKKIDIILIVQNGLSGIDLNELVNLCQQTDAQIKVLPDGLNLLNNYHWDLSLLRDVTVEKLLEREPVEIDENLCNETIKDKVVLVTGASGSIGSELCRQIITYKPSRLILLDNNESALHDLDIELRNKLHFANTRPVLVDITCASKTKELFELERPQIVFHAAAYKHVPMLEIYPEEAVRVNILGTMILSECAARYDTERFIFISTDKAVNPESVMGASKRICEMWLRALNPIAGGTYFSIVRFGNVIGSRGSVVPIFKRQIEWGGPLTVTHKEMTRYFMSIPEAVSLVLHTSTLSSQIDTYMLDMGKRISILDLAQRMIRERGLRVHDDIAIEFIGIRPGEKLHEELYYGNEARHPTDHPRIYSLTNPENESDFKTILGAVLLLADVAQRPGVSHILRRAILLAAYQDWNIFVKLMVDMGLLESYQHPATLLNTSVLLDQDIVHTFIQTYSPHQVAHEVE